MQAEQEQLAQPQAPAQSHSNTYSQQPGHRAGVRVYIDAWDPTYGSGMEMSDGGPTGETKADVRLDIELPADNWQALSPPPDLRAPSSVLFVDGIRRIDSNLWVEEADGTLLPGIAASYAAGVVRCDLRRGAADVITKVVQRGLFTASAEARGLSCGITRYEVRRVAATEPAKLSQAVQPFLQRLEVEVSHQARAEESTEDDLLVLDGPLRDRSDLPRALGYIKTHHQQYLPPEQTAVVRTLRAGQRTPVFLIGRRWQNYTWYLRLPGPAGSSWAGVVRVEAAADLSRTSVIELADLSALSLPWFASTPYKDARAPQNLTPIAGLEKRLRAMLGDQRLLLRSLNAAAVAGNRAESTLASTGAGGTLASTAEEGHRTAA